MFRRNFISAGLVQLAALAAAKDKAATSPTQKAAEAEAGANSPRSVQPGPMSGLFFPDRLRVPLDGEWAFSPVARTVLQRDGSFREDRANLPGAGRMRVPSNWHLAGLPDFQGRVAFRQRFTVSPDLPTKPVWLCFAGVDYFAQVSLNGQPLGEHEGYFEPFEIEVTGLLKKGSNLLEVIVNAPREEPKEVWFEHKRQIKGILNQWLPFERQMEPTGGIIGAVYLEWRARVQIRSTKFTTRLSPRMTGDSPTAPPAGGTPSKRTARVLVEVEFSLHKAGFADLAITVGQTRWQGNVLGRAGSNRHLAVLTIEDPQLWWTWDFGEPHLYDASVTLTQEGEADRCESKVGIREIQFDPAHGEWRLNGERFFVRGSSVIPDKWLAHYTEAQVSKDMDLLRKAFINGVRVCVHVTRDEFYAACDRTGILVWQDFPLQWDYTLDTAFLSEATRQIRAMIRHLYNHPCIGLWTCQNEPKPANRENNDPTLAVAAREEDSSRYVSEACAFQEHPYPGWYYGDVHNFELIPGAPVVSEFGAQGLLSPDEMRELLGTKLWPPNADWVDKGFEPRSTFVIAGVPEGKNLEEFIANSQAYQARLIQFAVEHYRRVKYEKLGGFFHFMFMDGWLTIGWSVLSYNRVPKAGYRALQRAMQPVLAMVELPAARLERKPETMALTGAWLVNDTRQPLDNCRVTFELRGPAGHISLGEFRVDVPADSIRSVVPGGRVEMPFPAGTELAPGDWRFVASVHASSGALLSENAYEVKVIDIGNFATSA